MAMRTYYFESLGFSVFHFLLCFLILPQVLPFVPHSSDSRMNTNHYFINVQDLRIDSSSLTSHINDHCRTDSNREKIRCSGLNSRRHLYQYRDYFGSVKSAEFDNCSVNVVHLIDLFPQVDTLTLTASPKALKVTSDTGDKRTWDSVKHLNIPSNQLEWADVSLVLPIFPNLNILDVSNNSLDIVELNDHLQQLRFVDISGNPLDCTSSHLEWIEDERVQLLHPEDTLCHLPPHQNKAKPIRQVWKLIKKIRNECRSNCTCDIAYIWEQNHVIHSKNVVNCSGRGFYDFPDPGTLPNPTDTLDLSYNNIVSVRRFVEDKRYDKIGLMNLHLDSNYIESIVLLDTSDWFDHFQVFTCRNNSLTAVPVYMLENAFAENKNILQLDISLNPFYCECNTLSKLKIWLLKHTANIKHIEEVKCSQTGQQIRYLKHEDWCTAEIGEESIFEALDILSVILALAILGIVAKVYYDYWNFKHNGKLPWLVTKI